MFIFRHRGELRKRAKPAQPAKPSGNKMCI